MNLPALSTANKETQAQEKTAAWAIRERAAVFPFAELDKATFTLLTIQTLFLLTPTIKHPLRGTYKIVSQEQGINPFRNISLTNRFLPAGSSPVNYLFVLSLFITGFMPLQSLSIWTDRNFKSTTPLYESRARRFWFIPSPCFAAENVRTAPKRGI